MGRKLCSLVASLSIILILVACGSRSKPEASPLPSPSVSVTTAPPSSPSPSPSPTAPGIGATQFAQPDNGTVRGATSVVLKTATFSSAGSQTLLDVYLLFQVQTGPVWVGESTIKAKQKESSALITGKLMPGSDVSDPDGKSFVDGEVAELRVQFRVAGYDVELVYAYDGVYLATWQVR